MNKPTPEELDELLLSHGMLDQWPTQKQGHAFTRAVLDKWGQPAHSGEPVAYCQPDDSNAGEAFSWPGTNRRDCHTTPLYTAPQPVEPTPEDQVFTALRDVDSLDALAVWRAAEQYHNIKGGQHGDT